MKERHDSIRGWFAAEVHEKMDTNKDIIVVTGDLGYKMWDAVRADYPDRFINVGAAEQAMMGIGVGLALEQKIPLVYSISTFLLYRPFETIRNYLHREEIPVKLIGSGSHHDYEHDGYSHWPEEDHEVMKILSNIEARWPQIKEDIPGVVEEMLITPKPFYINLKR